MQRLQLRMTSCSPLAVHLALLTFQSQIFPSGWNTSHLWRQYWPPVFLKKLPNLLAYQAAIIRAERNYEGKQWVACGSQYQRESLARKYLNWSLPNSRLLNETFTGCARAMPRCIFCLQDDHTTSTCTINPNRPAPWDVSYWPAQTAMGYVLHFTKTVDVVHLLVKLLYCYILCTYMSACIMVTISLTFRMFWLFMDYKLLEY